MSMTSTDAATGSRDIRDSRVARGNLTPGLPQNGA